MRRLVTFQAVIKISYPLFCLVVTLLTGLDSRHFWASNGWGMPKNLLTWLHPPGVD
jgi:hypothetical protein